MGNKWSSLRSRFAKSDNSASNMEHNTGRWTWKNSNAVIAQAGYHFVREISRDPYMCLARVAQTGYAVCILRRYRAEVEDSGEIRFWKWLEHQNCLPLYDKLADADSVYFVTDPVVGGHVSGLLEKSEVGAGEARQEFFRNVTRHVMGALASMHEIGLAHLDFRWSNVWIDAANNVFLGGFVKTRSIKPPGDPSVGVVQLTYGGNVSSLAPEILSSIIDGKQPDMALLPKADMWAVGVALVEALTDEWVGGIRLNTKQNDLVPAAVLKALTEEGGIDRVRSHLLDHGIGAAAIAFIVHLLKLDPTKRPLASQCLRQLWLMEKQTGGVMQNLLKMGINPEDAVAAEQKEEEVTESLPKVDNPIGEKLRRFGYEIQGTISEDFAGGTVIVTAKCEFNGEIVTAKAVRESACEKGERFYWQQLRHESCMQLLDSFTDSGVAFFVVEYMVMGNVEQHAQKERVHDEREAFYRTITINMVDALCYLHQQGFAHLDFNFKNVLLNESGNVKLSGFTHLNSLQDEERPVLGYVPFRPPESFIPGALRRTTLQKADIWSLGAALLRSVAQLSIGGRNFDERQVRANQRKYTFANIENNLPRLTKALANRPRGGNSQEFQDFVNSVLHFQPELRPTSLEITSHAWLLQSSEPKPGIDVV